MSGAKQPNSGAKAFPPHPSAGSSSRPPHHSSGNNRFPPPHPQYPPPNNHPYQGYPHQPLQFGMGVSASIGDAGLPTNNHYPTPPGYDGGYNAGLYDGQYYNDNTPATSSMYRPANYQYPRPPYPTQAADATPEGYPTGVPAGLSDYNSVVPAALSDSNSFDPAQLSVTHSVVPEGSSNFDSNAGFYDRGDYGDYSDFESDIF